MTVWIKHPDTGGVSEVPKDALPIYRQSGWQDLSDTEVEALLNERADEQAKAEQRLIRLGQQALGNEPPAPPEQSAAEPKSTTKSSTKAKES